MISGSGEGEAAGRTEGAGTVKEQKEALRRQGLRRRSEMGAEVRAEASRRAWVHLEATPVYREAATMALFLAFGDEIDTWSLLHKALGSGKRVFAPKVNRRPRMLLWGEVTADEGNLQPGPYQGIMEPVDTLPPGSFEPDLVIVPGAVFDADGYRIGYGGGFYDRCLAGWPNAVKVGVAFDVQRVARVPREAHDVPVSWLVTESGVHRLGAGA